MSSNPKLPAKWFPHARPVIRPIVAPDFFEVPGWRRSLKSIQYWLLCLEHYISPSGVLRELIRFQGFAVILIGTGVLLTGPVITALLESILLWMSLAVKIMIKAVSVVSILPPLFVSVVAGMVMWGLFKNRRGGRKSVRQTNHDPYYE